MSTDAGQELLLPLTSSLYVRGTLEDTDKVLVNVGTGYYVEVWPTVHLEGGGRERERERERERVRLQL